MAVDGVGSGGGHQMIPVKSRNDNQKLAPDPQPDLAQKPAPPLSPSPVDVKV